MPFVVVNVQIESGERQDQALALDVPSRELAIRIMRQAGKSVRTGEVISFFILTPAGEKRIPPSATLAQLGITDGQRLRVRRESQVPAEARITSAWLQTKDGRKLPLTGNNMIVGRRDSRQQMPLDLDLADYDTAFAVSRRHASIGRDGDTYYLLDLQSTNGTFVNGEPVLPGKRLELHDGDQVEFGPGMRVTFMLPK